MPNKLIDIQAVLTRLAEVRPIFHSEADFQFAFAWVAAQMYQGLQVRLEARQPNGRELDLLVADESFKNRIAIEFKHLTTAWDGSVNGERFRHGKPLAPNLGRRGIVRDIERVEGFVKDGLATAGAVVVISNNDVYWKAPGRRYCSSINYRIHDGAVLSGTLSWHPKNPAWTGHHSTLVGSYTAAWSPYSDPAGGPGPFQTLVFETS